MTEPTDQLVSRGERQDLIRILKLRAKVSDSDLAGVAAARKADVDRQLAEQFKASDDRWKELIAQAEAVVADANDRINAVLDVDGVPKEFRPRLNLSWANRGENADSKRRAELRKVAYTAIDDDLKNARASLQRAATEQIVVLIAGGITSAEGVAALEALPMPEDLIPHVDVAALERERHKLHKRLTGGRNGWRYRYDTPRELERFTDDLGEPGDPKDRRW